MLDDDGVKERNKGMLVMLGTAAIAGVVLEVQRHRAKDAQAPAATPAVSAASAAPLHGEQPPRVATRAEIERSIKKLEGLVRTGASDSQSPWALAHGLLAFGPELTASNGKLAIDVIGSFAEKQSDGSYQFAQNQSVEPHRHLLVKTLLEIETPLDRKLVAADGKTLTLARLIADLKKSAKLPESDAEWHHAAWLLSALTLAEARGTKATGELTAAELGAAALTRLERDHRVVTEFAGAPSAAFDPGTPLYRAKESKTGIYGHSCGGLHLVQAVTSSVMAKKDPEALRRLGKQLGVLAFRYEAERAAYARLIREHPEHGLILRVQQLKFFGHLVETLTLAKKLGAYRQDTEGGKKLDRITEQAAADVVDVVAALDRGGVPVRLFEIRKQREQTYLDLIGDGCHAIHGLRRLYGGA